MSQTTIDRLDYSKPPPGYGVADNTQAFRAPDGPLGSPGAWRNAADGLLAAWAHYKAHSDPPGMTVVHNGWYVDVRPSALAQVENNMVLARAAAWAWYDRRGVLADKVNAQILDSRYVAVDGPIWPTVLTWSDKQVAEVDRWLVDSTAEMPEVLRG